MKIKEINNLSEILPALAILKHSYPELTESGLKNRLSEMQQTNTKFVAAFADHEIIGFATYWIGTRFYAGKFVQIDSLIIKPKSQDQGIGTAILEFIEQIGYKNNCRKYVLDVYVENQNAQKLYVRQGFSHRGFHMVKELG